MPVTDIHAHFIPAWLVEEARAGDGVSGLSTVGLDGTEVLVHPEGYRYPIDPAFFDAGSRLATMDGLGIDHAVVSASPTVFFHRSEPGAGADIARRTNDELARHVAAGDGRLSALASLPMQDPDAARHELHRAVRELGMLGAAIAPVVGDQPLDAAPYRTVLEAAEELDVPLLLHPAYVGPRPGLGDFYLTNLVGNPLETTVAVARLILSGALDELPGLRLVLVHAGGFVPYQIGRLDHGWRVRPESGGCAAAPSTYLRRFVFDTITHGPAALGFLVGLVGADRVAYGTDTPFDMMDGSLDAQLDGLEVPPDDRELIASGTAEHWFRISSRAAIGPPARP